MKILKIILLILAGLIGLVLIAALFVPKDYTVSVSTTINQPLKTVFDYVKLVKNQENYDVWVLEDPNIKIEYTGIDGTLGFNAAWDSQIYKIGKGSQKITKIIDGKRIDLDLKFEKPFVGTAKTSTFVKDLSATQTLVVSEFYGHSPYPANLFSFICQRLIKEPMNQNLGNLKKILETK